MLKDDRTEQLRPFEGGRRIYGCMGLIAAIALTSSSMHVDVEGGIGEFDGKVAPIPSQRVECRAGDALAASSEGWTAVVAYYLPSTDTVYVRAIDGAEALTSAGAVKPTAAEISAELPSTAVWALMFDAKFVRDSGSVVTCTLDRSRRAYGVPENLHDLAAPKTSADDALYRPWGRIRLWGGLATAIANVDMVTDLPLPLIKGRVSKLIVVCEVAITTAAKTADLNVEIGSTNVTGTLTYASTKAKGAVAEQALSGSNTFVPGDVLSLEAAAVTAFIEGEVSVYLDIDELITGSAA